MEKYKRRIYKEEIKLSFFTDDMITYIENLRLSTKRKSETIKQL